MPWFTWRKIEDGKKIQRSVKVTTNTFSDIFKWEPACGSVYLKEKHIPKGFHESERAVLAKIWEKDLTICCFATADPVEVELLSASAKDGEAHCFIFNFQVLQKTLKFPEETFDTNYLEQSVISIWKRMFVCILT